MDLKGLKRRLALPVVAAPMFLVSGTDLLIECCKAGIVGTLPAANARSTEQLADWLGLIESTLEKYDDAAGSACAPWAINIVVEKQPSARFLADAALISRYRAPIVITSFGPPGALVARVHDYGGLVFHDVSTMRHVEKAMAAGVDGLILLTAGAGGHTGSANPFAFVPQVRKIWDGAIVLAGSISDGAAVRAAEILGADFAYMGTRFAATRESLAEADYKALLVAQRMDDIITTDRISGVTATFMRGSIERLGLDADNLPQHRQFREPDLPIGIRAWRDVWSAGHGVGGIDDVPTVAELVARLRHEYHQADRVLKEQRDRPAAATIASASRRAR